MNAPSRNFGSVSCFRSPQHRSLANVSETGMRWAALYDAGQVVAMTAGLEAEPPSRAVRDFPALISKCDLWRRDQARNGCADLAAVMEQGMSALLAINARGADCRPAALALWHEFVAARSALLVLLPDTGGERPRRGA